MEKSVRFFTYISKSKVEMLLPQIRKPKAGLKGLKPKLALGPFSLEAHLEEAIDEGAAADALALIEGLEGQGLVGSLGDGNALDSDVIYKDRGNWHQGVFELWYGDERIRGYGLWKAHEKALILLVGSVAHLVGESESYENVRSVYSGDLMRRLFRAFRGEFPREDVNHDEDIRGAGEASETGLALGQYCVNDLGELPQTPVETMFKIYWEQRLRRKEILEEWTHVIEKSNYWLRPDEVERLYRCQYVYLGSPIYAAWK